MCSRAEPAVICPLMAELRAAEQRVVCVNEPLIAAPVDVERRALARGPRRVEVGVDVRSPEGVDRLLGIADEHERHAAPAERPAHDPPLDGVGVLELVDEDHAVPRAQPRRDGLVLERPI